MESGEGFMLVLFFQGRGVLLYHFVSGRGSRFSSRFGNRGRGCLDDFSNDRCRFNSSRCRSGCQFGFLLQTLGFTLATTHFTRIVRCTAIFSQGADWSGFNYRCNHFGDNRRFNHCRRLGSSNHGFGNHGFCNWSFNDWRWCWCFNDRWLGNPVERGLLFTNFANSLGHGFRNGFNNRFGYHGRRFSHDGRFCKRCHFWLGFTNRSDFNFRHNNSFYQRRCFNHWRFNSSGFLNGSSSAFSLLVGLCFSRCTDHGAGNCGGDRQACGQIGSAWRIASFGAFSRFGLFRTFDHVAVGITLTLATVAATTLTTGAAAWTIAFGAVLTVFRQLLFVAWQFFFGDGSSGLLGTWLTLFTRWAWRAFFTWLTGRTLFSGGSNSNTSNSRSSIQRFAQFTNRTLFALASWLALFAWRARCTFFTRGAWCTLFTWSAFFAGYYCRGFFTGFAWLTWCAFFTRCTFLTWLAFFITATVTVAALLTTVATLFVTGRTLGGRFFNHYRCSRLFLGGEQADQRLHQTFEQAWFWRDGWSCNRSCDDFGRHGCVGTGRSSLDRSFLANQGAGRSGWLDFFHFSSGSSDFVAGLVDVGFRAVITQALNFEVRRFEVIVRQNDDAGTGAQFDLGDRVAFFVEQERGHRDRHLCANFGGTVFQGFFFDQAQDRQRQRFNITDDAGAVATRANDATAFAQRWTQALTGHFQQAEARDATDLHASAVGFQAFADFLFHGALVLGRSHVDEVDDDQAADVAQAQLTGDFFGGFKVGLQGGFFDVAAFSGARRVDVDGHQGFGRIDNDGAAGRQFNDALESGLDLAFDLETVEQRNAVFVQLDLAGVLRHHLADEGQGFVLGFNAVDQHFADVLAQVVADGADDHVAFLIDQERRGAIQRGFFDGGPQLQQVVEVPLHFFAAAAKAGGANDQAHVGWRDQTVQRFTQFVAFFAFDTTGDTAGTRVVRHQHQVTTGQADEGGQGGALVATFFFFDLNDDFLAFAQDVLDVDAAFRCFLEVFAGDFFEWQEAVALGAEIDKGSLKAWFDASNPAFIDVGLLLLACTGLDVQIIEALAVYQCDTQLFGLSCVNQHSFHVVPSVSGLPETAFGTHDFSRSVSGASRVVGHSSVQQYPPKWAISRRTLPACCGDLSTQSGGGINRRLWTR